MSAFVPLTFPADHHRQGPERWFCVRGGKVLVSDRTEFGGEHHFLGALDGVACWAEHVPDDVPDDGAFVDLYSLFGRVDETEWAIAGRAVQIVDWAHSHRFCGRCGTATVHSGNDRSMACPACKLLAFPRLAPAIITLVTRGDEALLARGVQFRSPMFSCLAGFVEPGETLEQAVAREVHEEVGVTVDNIRYWGSQPWPFPHSLMLGFQADWVAGDIVIDPVEIAEAAWFTRDAVPNIPPRISIARKLIDLWLTAG
jgi:NAD+ diphosphatase